jgi:L-aminopeptidase/D-esterase-like protein
MSEKTAKPRARDLGLPFDGVTGKFNAITDVTGVEVGLTTLIEGEGAVEVGKGPIARASPRLCRAVNATSPGLSGRANSTSTATVK